MGGRLLALTPGRAADVALLAARLMMRG